MHRIRFRQHSAPDPAGGAYSAPPDLLAGLTAMGRKGEWKEDGEGGRNCVDPLRFCIFLRTPLMGKEWKYGPQLLAALLEMA